MSQSERQAIDTGDIVLHRPTGETWVVAGVIGDTLMWVGWPEGCAKLSDCELQEKATQNERNELLQRLSKMNGDDIRKRHAQRMLEGINDDTDR